MFTDKVTDRHTETQTDKSDYTIPHHKICEGVMIRPWIVPTREARPFI